MKTKILKLRKEIFKIRESLENERVLKITQNQNISSVEFWLKYNDKLLKQNDNLLNYFSV